MPVKPERAGGFNDYGPRAMSARHILERRIRENMKPLVLSL